jgi:hypothetical protein
MKFLPLMLEDIVLTGLSPVTHHKVKHNITGVKSGTVLLKPGRIHLNNISHHERDKFVTQQMEVNNRSA